MLLSEFLSFGLSSFCCLSVLSNKLHKGEDTLTGALGGSGLDPAELRKINIFSASVFGWFFDILLVAYAFHTKNFKLALYTIIGSLSIIGREFSKSLYLLDESQQMKKTLTNPSYARFNIDIDDGKYMKKTEKERNRERERGVSLSVEERRKKRRHQRSHKGREE